ncbi:Uncharacterized protein TCM_025585 [Theobroma cacao]|uniref:Uncharacterized protein n=1 Tax=Theobroma cacao TaxID=3641 RepID=A0A061EZM1_THECC|nr:Uncharacterized protein TCM_025585 [Theobroma cacao]
MGQLLNCSKQNSRDLTKNIEPLRKMAGERRKAPKFEPITGQREKTQLVDEGTFKEVVLEKNKCATKEIGHKDSIAQVILKEH